MTTDYELALTAYALALVKSPAALNILSRLSLSTNIVSQADTNGRNLIWFEIQHVFDNDSIKTLSR